METLVHPLDDFLLRADQHITQTMLSFLPERTTPPQQLHEAMHYYTVLTGGKHLRPLLVYAAGISLGASFETLSGAAAAVEFIHAYSLIHDDLPAMDNDDFRRGYPSCHKAFGEATAILAGDALQALAFQALAQTESMSSQQQQAMVICLAKAVGAEGMVGGQAFDLEANTRLSKAALENIHRRKTGALIQASVKLATIAAKISDKTLLHQLDQFSDTLGLAYQIQDDLQDFDTESNDGKSSFAHHLGIDAAKQSLADLRKQALAILHRSGMSASLLASLAMYILSH